jgi:probable HAF family extracellular repeat protein
VNVSNRDTNSTFAMFLLTLALLAVTAHAQTIRYRVVPVSPPPSGAGGRLSASDLNNKGWIAATNRVTGLQPQGFLWRDGKTVLLPSLGGTCSFANGLNDARDVAGTACLSGDAVHHAALWRQNRVTDLGTFGGIGSGASQVNKNDGVAGVYTLSDGTTHGFFWQNGTWEDLGNLGGGVTFPEGLNSSNVVTGQADISNDPDPVYAIPPFHGFVWRSGEITDFGRIFDSDFNYGSAIDATGRVVGSADLAGDTAAHAFVWDHGSVQDIGTEVGDDVSWALDINNKGQIVGSSGSFDPFPEGGPPLNTIQCPCHGVLWENGKASFLDGLVEPGWSLLLALHINDDGEIIARGQQNGGPLLTVALEPIKKDASATLDSASVSTAGTSVSENARTRIYRDRRGQLWIAP